MVLHVTNLVGLTRDQRALVEGLLMPHVGQAELHAHGEYLSFASVVNTRRQETKAEQPTSRSPNHISGSKGSPLTFPHPSHIQ